jgi:hypothetical protein
MGYTRRRKPKQTGDIGYTRRRKPTQKHNATCVGQHYAQTSTNNVNKTLSPPTNNWR